MASQSDISAALQRAGVTVYGLQVSGNTVSGAVASEEARSQAYSAIAGVDNSASLNLTVNTGFAAQEASAASTGSAVGKSYTVQSGDTLSKIAKQHYGDAGEWRKIFEANRGTISDPDKIQVGQQLTIPS
jgi:nucleoid-associated protein YgaU